MRSTFAITLASCVWSLAACHHAVAPADSANVVKDTPIGVTVTAAQLQKLGITLQQARSSRHVAEVQGFGIVMDHDSLAQAVAELATSNATARLSRAALARAQKLQGTPGAVSVDVVETAEQKAEVDSAALRLAKQKLSTVVGMHPPWRTDDSATLNALSNGKSKLVRATFPMDRLLEGTPSGFRATHMGNSASQLSLTPVWAAPADTNMPGRSFFSLLTSGEAAEGERLQIWAPLGEAQDGVLIPASAILLSDGKYWCYVERQRLTFVRAEIDTDKPDAGGYFVTDGIAVGDRVVTSGAAQLLAMETGSASESD